jgi:hypothetical protein
MANDAAIGREFLSLYVKVTFPRFSGDLGDMH